ncbi:MAG: signal peptidase II, partial [Clostridia bacterium]|nr:signal peptidase II [Clostridia bacterium]
MAEKKKLRLRAHFGKIAAIMIAAFAVMLALDLILKHFAFKDAWEFTVIPNVIWVKEERNFGAAFSFLSGTSWGKIFLIVLTFILLIAIIFVFIILPERFVILKLVLAMMAAGALGNLIDRLAFGYVRDFVYLNMLFSS